MRSLMQYVLTRTQKLALVLLALLVLLFLFAGGLYLLRKYLCVLHQNKENRK